MEQYLVVYDAQTKIKMTKQEVQDFLLALNSNDVVEFKGQFLTKFFKCIVKDDLTEGRLWDGTRVVKRFDRWEDKKDPSIILDPTYYPELYLDKVLSEKEYQDEGVRNNHISMMLNYRLAKKSLTSVLTKISSEEFKALP